MERRHRFFHKTQRETAASCVGPLIEAHTGPSTHLTESVLIMLYRVVRLTDTAIL